MLRLTMGRAFHAAAIGLAAVVVLSAAPGRRGPRPASSTTIRSPGSRRPRTPRRWSRGTSISRSISPPTCSAVPATRRRTSAPRTSTPSTRCPTRAGSRTGSAPGRCRSRTRCAVRLRSNGPVPEGWTVTRAKEAGVSPGFTMQDAAGETWFVSFDPRGFPESVTGGVMVANKIFWALGYYQVENHLITVRPDRLGIADKATFRPPSGTRRPLRRGDLDDVFERAHRNADGTLPGRRRPGRPRQGARRLPLSRDAARRSERRRAARAPARAARAQGVRRVDQPGRHEGRQHARHR